MNNYLYNTFYELDKEIKEEKRLFQSPNQSELVHWIEVYRAVILKIFTKMYYEKIFIFLEIFFTQNFNALLIAKFKFWGKCDNIFN